MPIYKVKCDKCARQDEVICSVSKRNRLKCVEDEDGKACEGRMEPQVAVCSFALKGSGWYKDGYGG